MLARGILVPGAVATHDLQQFLDRRLAFSGGEIGDGQVEARLQVVGLEGDALAQFGGGAGLLRLLLHLDGAARGGDIGVARQIGRQLFEQALGAVHVAQRQGGADQAGDGARVLRVLGQDLLIDGRRGGGVALVEHLLGLGQRVVDAPLHRTADQALDEGLDLAVRQRAGEPVHRPAALEGVDGGHRLDAQLRRQFLVLVDVDLDHAHRALGGVDGLFQRRAELFARAAPRRPEIDDDGNLHRRLDDVLGEAGGVAVLDQGAGRGLRARSALTATVSAAAAAEQEIHGASSVSRVHPGMQLDGP